MNAVSIPPRPGIAARTWDAIASWALGVRALPGIPKSIEVPAVLPYRPQGDEGRRVSYSDRGKRPTPQNRNPATYSPEGWSDSLDQSRTDPKMAAGCWTRSDTFGSAEVRAVPGDASAGAAESAALVNELLGWDGKAGYLDRGWDQVFAELCCIADLKGASLGEERWEFEGGVYRLADIEQRHIANLRSWDLDERSRIVGVNMRTADLFREYKMPLYSAADDGGGGVHFTFSIDGDPEGRLSAILGPVIDWAALKTHMTAKAWDGVSRWAMPVVMSVLRTELAQKMGLSLNDPIITQAVADAGEAATDFLSGEEGALHASDMVGFEAFGGQLDLKAWVELCNLVDHQGLTAIGTPNLTMGVSATNGSHSAAEAIDDLLLRSVSGRLTRFLAQFRRQCGRRLVRFNLGNLAPIPMLVHEGIDVDGTAAHMGNIPHLVATGIIDPRNPADRRKVRRTLGLDPSVPYAPPPALASAPVPGNPGSPGPGRGNDFAPDGTQEAA